MIPAAHNAAQMSDLRNPFAALALSLLVLPTACMPVDPVTGEYKPRGNQRYEYHRVKEKAERLEKGMTKYQVLMLLGSPAEKAMRGDTWVYLPERAGVLLPASALKLDFREGRLHDFGYHAIILGQRI